ncbi:hypothetical protein AVEN_128061-1 [Araneus ventricosus]|uniref:Uncharacterized protein n=1 Tax=Araneus ventricosus TaxID=182803 RepID=A0A4Y2A0F3_ARAVE|nr:hypothetical protein AVEN_128061-1 [Araneus ventricosus]
MSFRTLPPTTVPNFKITPFFSISRFLAFVDWTMKEKYRDESSDSKNMILKYNIGNDQIMGMQMLCPDSCKQCSNTERKYIAMTDLSDKILISSTSTPDLSSVEELKKYQADDPEIKPIFGNENK